MFNMLKKAAVAVAVAMSITSGALAATVYIDNGTISADVNQSGTFATLSKGASEFVNWGTPMSYYWLNANVSGSPFIADNASSTNPLGAMTVGFGTVSFSGASGGLTFNQTISLIGDKASVTVVLSNNTSSAINGVQWGVGIDPDQGKEATFDTKNIVLGQGVNAAVRASDPNDPADAVVLRNTTASSVIQARAYIDTTCCSPVDPASILGGSAQSVGYSLDGDYSINLAYDIGTIGGNSSVSFGYEYVFAPVPEPEIYAMMAAGLGLMGFVARRRQRNGAVA